MRITGTDGRHLLELVRGRRHSQTLPVLGYSDHLTVTVTGPQLGAPAGEIQIHVFPLSQDQKTLTVSKVPLLGDIPGLGTLFSRTQVDKTKTELLIFLTPHVALAPDRLKPEAPSRRSRRPSVSRRVPPTVRTRS